jgi:molybdate transport system substrate-binding protein
MIVLLVFRSRNTILLRSWILSLLLLASASLQADTLRIAVASNFAHTLEAISQQFEEEHDVDVQISSASSGKLSAQIQHGAPFDLFFSADSAQPQYLIERGLAESNSRFTYAIGVLVVWAPGSNAESVEQQLRQGSFAILAIANSRVAPYGKAAEQLLQKLNIPAQFIKVQGENISQTFQFVHSGNADIGLVALSQLHALGLEQEAWLVPQEFYDPIRQDAVVLTRAKNNAKARQFMRFIRSESVSKEIASYGYKQIKAAP